MEGADYAINMIQVGGYEPCTVTDFEVPKQFGLRQTIADTLGIGGIMRGLRTIPVMLDMCADMEELCPDVWFLNYTNPMAINCRAVSRASSIRTVGLCHSVQGTAFELSLDLGIPYREIDYLAAGINHMAFYLRFSHGRRGSVSAVAGAGASRARCPRAIGCATRCCKHFGYFVTESSEHFAEYVPWFIKRDRPDLVVVVQHSARRVSAAVRRADRGLGSRSGRGWRAAAAFEVQPSFEYAATIIRSIETGKPRVIYGNVPNDGSDRRPARRAARSRCRAWSTGTACSRRGSVRCRRSWRR